MSEVLQSPAPLHNTNRMQTQTCIPPPKHTHDTMAEQILLHICADYFEERVNTSFTDIKNFGALVSSSASNCSADHNETFEFLIIWRWEKKKKIPQNTAYKQMTNRGTWNLMCTLFGLFSEAWCHTGMAFWWRISKMLVPSIHLIKRKSNSINIHWLTPRSAILCTHFLLHRKHSHLVSSSSMAL